MIYSDNLEGALYDLGFSSMSDDDLLDRFSGVTLDIGSGVEGLARGLQEKASKLGREITIVSLNPQFIDWHRGSNNEIVYKYEGIRNRIDDEPFGSEYLLQHRVALAGLVQALPFRDNSFDNIVSTWCFPTVFQERNYASAEFQAAFAEIIRVLKTGGEARLSPIQVMNARSALVGTLTRDEIDLMIGSLDVDAVISWEWSNHVSEEMYKGWRTFKKHTILSLYKKTTGVVGQAVAGRKLS